MIQKLRLIWGLMLSTVFVYAALAYAFSVGLIPLEFPDTEDATIFAVVLGFLSVSFLTASYLLPSRSTALPDLQVKLIRFAFLEAIGVLGLVYVISTGDFQIGIYYFAASFLCLLAAFPKDEEKSN